MDLRPMRAGELLDRTFSTLRDHFLLFVGIAAIPLLAGVLLPVLIVPTSLTAGTLMGARAISLIVLGSLLYALVILPATVGATASAVASLAKGEPATIREAWRHSVRRIPSLIGSTTLAYMAIMGAAGLLFIFVFGVIAMGRGGSISMGLGILLAVPLGFAALAFSVWVGMGLALAQPAVVLENAGPLTSLKRSLELAKGGRWRILLIYVLYAIIGFVVKMVFNIPALFVIAATARHGNPFWVMIATSWVGVLSSILILPLLAIGLTLEYLNQRIQKEAFDLQVMLNALQTPAMGAAAEVVPSAGAQPPSASTL